MKNRILSAFWFCFALAWIILGSLYLIRLHNQLKGGVSLALGGISLFVALRFRKWAAARQMAIGAANSDKPKPPNV